MHEETVCSVCSYPYKGTLKRHLSESCNMRIINCPNKSFGCQVSITLKDVLIHLLEYCDYEKKKELLAAKSRLRDELIACPGCSEEIQIRKIHKHDQEECVNRKVSCRNSYLGCQYQPRVKEKDMHEEVDKAMLIPRYCLYLGGGGSDLGHCEAEKLCHGGSHIFLGIHKLSFK